MGQPVSNSFRYFNPDGTTRHRRRVRLLDRPAVRSGRTASRRRRRLDAGDDQRARQDRAGAVGSVHPGRLRRRRRSRRRTPCSRTPAIDVADGVRRRLARGRRGRRRQRRAGRRPSPTSSASACTAPRAAARLHAGEPRREPDLLPDEPGGYNGYKGLFGAKYVNPAIKPSGPMTDLDGNADHRTRPATSGFPGFDGMAATSRSSTSRRCRRPAFRSPTPTSPTRTTTTARPATCTSRTAPARPATSQQLKDYDDAFAKFFDRLAADGINKSNTLFVFTVDEGDHFVGDAPTPGGLRRRQHAVQLQPRRRDQRRPAPA